MKLRNKVIDYVTPTEACKIIGISEKSTPLITRWINQGKIKDVITFGKSKGIPINWVKSECNERGINWEGIKLEDGEVGVSLKDYEPVNKIEQKYQVSHLAIRITRGQINSDYAVQFGRNWGIEKEYMKTIFE